MAISKVALVNELNYKNVTAFLTKAFEYKAALNKLHLFIHFALVVGLYIMGDLIMAR